MPSAALQGLDLPAVTAWLADHVDGLRPPFAATLVAGGRSNLTYALTDAVGRRIVLRRPPLGHVLATAHDMAREHRIIAALGGSAVPVAPALGLCEDLAVNGAPFYVMGFVDGVIARNAEVTVPLLDVAQRAAASRSMADVLAALHAIDPDDVGLGTLGRKEGYVARQLKRWHAQWESSKTREIPEVESVHERLAATIPGQGRPSIVHGDYRIDNCVVGHDGSLVAVLDWELCTLGDGRADLGMLSICWTEPGGTATARPDAPTVLPGFWTGRQVLERYAEVSGADLSTLPFFEALAYWKLACISEGVYARYLGGAMGEQPDIDLDVLGTGAPRLAAAAQATLDAAA